MTMKLDTALHAGQAYVLKLNGEVEKAAKVHRPYAVLACVPQGIGVCE